MKIVKISLFAIVLMCTFAFSQAMTQDVDYHSSWVLDKAKSTIEGNMSEWLVGMELVVSITGDNLKLECTYQTNDNNFTDVIELTLGGEAKIRDMLQGRGKATSQAQWDEPQKSVKMHTDATFEGDNGTFKFTTDDHFSLSEDEQNLILKRKSESERGLTNSTFIFKKKV